MKNNTRLYRELLAPIQRRLDAVEAEIDRELQSDIKILSEMSTYLSRTKGKRIRPALFLLCSDLLGVKNSRDVAFATVIEFIHTATLVHDDIIDGSDTRRGKKTVNAIWGNELTVLLGDYLYLKAVELALTEGKIEILAILSETTLKMIEGELIQLSRRGRIDTSEADYLDIVRRKTAYLFSGCGRISSVLASAPEEQGKSIAEYCFNLGVAFQLVDDVLDFTAESKVLGKPINCDLGDGIATLPLIYALQTASPDERANLGKILQNGNLTQDNHSWILGLLNRHGSLERTMETAKGYSEKAMDSLDIFPPSDAKTILSALPSFVVSRSH